MRPVAGCSRWSVVGRPCSSTHPKRSEPLQNHHCQSYCVSNPRSRSAPPVPVFVLKTDHTRHRSGGLAPRLVADMNPSVLLKSLDDKMKRQCRLG